MNTVLQFNLNSPITDISCEIASEHQSAFYKISNLRGIEFKHCSESSQKDYKFTIATSNAYRYKLENKKLVVFTPSNEILSSESIQDLLYQYICFLMYEVEHLVLHSTSLYIDGIAVLILGDSGTGKTEIGKKLYSNYGFKFLTDDRTCIDFSKLKPVITNNDISVSERLFLRSEELNTYTVSKQLIKISYQAFPKHTIRFAIFPKLSRFNTKLEICQEHYGIEQFLKNFLTTLRGTDFCLISETGQFVGLAPDYFLPDQRQLQTIVHRIVQNITFIKVSGDSDFICREISNLCLSRTI